MDRDYDFNDEMCLVASNCKYFSKARNVNSFNMTTYTSCENCRHFTSDYRCGLKNSDRILFKVNGENLYR